MRTKLLPALLLLAVAACGSKSSGGTTTPDQPEPDAGVASEHAPTDLLAAEAAAYEAAKPVFTKYCDKCHNQSGEKAEPDRLGHFDETTYPFGGHHVTTMAPTIRHVLGLDGSEPEMPKDKPGAVQGDELALIAAWADAWDAAADGGAHEGVPGYQDEHHHDH
jgi:hypothetical protein